MSVGPAEILVILVVALLVFGPRRLPEVGRQVGAAMRELRRMQDAVRGELDMVLHPEHGTRTAAEPASTEARGPAELSGPAEPGSHGTPGADAVTPDAVPPAPAAGEHEPSAPGEAGDRFAGPDSFS